MGLWIESRWIRFGLAEKHDLYVIEDNAECFLDIARTYSVRVVIVRVSVLSSKLFTSGEGGMIITDD